MLDLNKPRVAEHSCRCAGEPAQQPSPHDLFGVSIEHHSNLIVRRPCDSQTTLGPQKSRTTPMAEPTWAKDRLMFFLCEGSDRPVYPCSADKSVGGR